MLQMLRRYIKPDGRIIFSLFVNEVTGTGLGHIDMYHDAMLAADNPNLEPHRATLLAAAKAPSPPDFLDFYPAHPLKCAIYSREYALRLLENTGWKLESLNNPETCIQHYMICTPI
jgi:hypothetical protein